VIPVGQTLCSKRSGRAFDRKEHQHLTRLLLRLDVELDICTGSSLNHSEGSFGYIFASGSRRSDASLFPGLPPNLGHRVSGRYSPPCDFRFALSLMRGKEWRWAVCSQRRERGEELRCGCSTVVDINVYVYLSFDSRDGNEETTSVQAHASTTHACSVNHPIACKFHSQTQSIPHRTRKE